MSNLVSCLYHLANVSSFCNVEHRRLCYTKHVENLFESVQPDVVRFPVVNPIRLTIEAESRNLSVL